MYLFYVTLAMEFPLYGSGLQLGLITHSPQQGLIEPPKAARGHVTSVNGKIQNNVIYRTLLLLLATPDVCEIRYLRATPAARKTDGDVATSWGPLDGVLHSISDGPSRFLSTVSIVQVSWPALDNIPQNSHNCILFHYTVVLTIVVLI